MTTTRDVLAIHPFLFIGCLPFPSHSCYLTHIPLNTSTTKHLLYLHLTLQPPCSLSLSHSLFLESHMIMFCCLTVKVVEELCVIMFSLSCTYSIFYSYSCQSLSLSHQYIHQVNVTHSTLIHSFLSCTNKHLVIILLCVHIVYLSHHHRCQVFLVCFQSLS